MLDLHLMFDTTHHQNNIVHVASAMQWRREEDISNLFSNQPILFGWPWDFAGQEIDNFDLL